MSPVGGRELPLAPQSVKTSRLSEFALRPSPCHLARLKALSRLHQAPVTKR